MKQYQKLFELDGVKLEFDDEALKAIAEKSLERKTGARGLRAIMESTMMDVMFDAPSDNTIQECRITREAVEKKRSRYWYTESLRPCRDVPRNAAQEEGLRLPEPKKKKYRHSNRSVGGTVIGHTSGGKT